MPQAIPLIMAAGSVSAGVTAMAAATTLTGSIIGGMMIAGGALTAVGVLTGSQKMQKWGGILSLAGGVAGLATGAWQTAATEIGNGAFLGEGVASGVPAWDAAASAPGMSGLTSGAGFSADLGALNEANQAVSGAMGAPASAPAGVAGNQAATNALKAATAPPSAGGGMLDSIKSGASGIGDTVKSGFKWMGASPENARLTQAGAGLLQAGLGAYGQQEAMKEQLKAQEELDARRRQRMSDSVKGVRVPVYQPKPRG
jgi:hypothetical protein